MLCGGLAHAHSNVQPRPALFTIYPRVTRVTVSFMKQKQFQFQPETETETWLLQMFQFYCGVTRRSGLAGLEPVYCGSAPIFHTLHLTGNCSEMVHRPPLYAIVHPSGFTQNLGGWRQKNKK